MEIYDPAQPVDPAEARAAELDAYKADMARRGFDLEALTIDPGSLGFDGYLELAYEMGVTEYREPSTYDAAPRDGRARDARALRGAEQREIAAPPTEALQRVWANSANPVL